MHLTFGVCNKEHVCLAVTVLFPPPFYCLFVIARYFVLQWKRQSVPSLRPNAHAHIGHIDILSLLVLCQNL